MKISQPFYLFILALITSAGHTQDPMNPPTGLNYTIEDENDVNLFWLQPSSGSSTYLHWDSGENEDSFGFFLSAEEFDCAARWDPDQITGYDGWLITSLKFYVVSDDPTITLKIWTGPEATEVYSQDVTDYLVNDWTEVTLEEPFTIDAGTELWAGINIDMPYSGTVMGMDGGPAITGYGDLLYWSGQWWNGTTMGYDANWNIQIKIEEPSAPVSLHWDSGENEDSYGFFLSAEEFDCAAKWDPDQITGYDGWTITSLRFFVTNSNPGVKIKLWTGEEANEVYSQDVTDFEVNAWTEVLLDEPYTIDAGTELWAGVNIDMPFSGAVMGLDGGPAITDYGDLMYWNGQWWNGTTAGFDANWNIQITLTGPGSKAATGLLGYNVYRDDEMINENPVMSTAYVDMNLSNGIYEYYVTALYEGGESVPSDPVEVIINQPVIDINDSLAVVDIYNNCNGVNWPNTGNWFVAPLSEWEGISTTGNRVTSIWLSFQGLTGDIPGSLGDLTALEKLHLEQNSIETLPESMGNLTSLNECWLGGNDITDLPESFGDLTALEELHIGFLPLGELPESFGNLSSLKWLALGDSELNSLPENFGNLTSLQICFLWGNNLTQLPDNFGELESLLYLTADDNQLTSLPDNFGDLDNLSTLILEYNQLTSLPESFGDLQSLDSLYLGANQLTTLPGNFGDLDDLQYLVLAQNSLTSLPESFGDMATIEEVYLDYNQLEELPGSIGNLSTMFAFSVSHNNLTQLPESITQLDNLQVLFALSNQLGSIPESIGDMTSLKFLGLDQNNITAVPESIGDLSSLGYIGLSTNSIQGLPESFGNLEADTVLLFSNQIPELPSTMFDDTFQFLWVEDNALQFGSLEPFIGNVASFTYAGQAMIGEETSIELVNSEPLEYTIEVSGEYNVYTWYKDGILLPGQTTNTLTLENAGYSDQGVYHLTVSNTLITDLVLTSHDLELSILSTVNDNTETSCTLIYPNPASEGTVHFCFDQDVAVKEITILSISGNIMETRSNPENTWTLDVSDLEPGIYFVKITYGDGRMESEKLILN